ncbi:hypothetical protein VPHK460_0077 [Vibrio phage K460]
MADNFGTLNSTTISTASDAFLVRQNNIDYKQNREVLAAGLANARWTAGANYEIGTVIIASDNLPYKAVAVSGVDSGGAVDPTTDTDKSHWEVYLQNVEPRNNDWNGYLNPDHTTPLELENTSVGTRSFVAGTEVAPNLTFTAETDVTFANDGWSWLAGNALTKSYEYTTEQIALIDINKVPICIKNQAGKVYFFKNGDTGVTVSISDNTLTVSLDGAIFSGDITKVWRFFVTEKEGSVAELSPSEVEFNILGFNAEGEFVFYKDKRFKYRTSVNTGRLAAGEAFDASVNLPFALDTSRSFQFASSAYSGNNTTDASLVNAYVALATQNTIRIGGRNVTAFNQAVGTQVTLILEGYLL